LSPVALIPRKPDSGRMCQPCARRRRATRGLTRSTRYARQPCRLCRRSQIADWRICSTGQNCFGPRREPAGTAREPDRAADQQRAARKRGSSFLRHSPQRINGRASSDALISVNPRLWQSRSFRHGTTAPEQAIEFLLGDAVTLAGAALEPGAIEDRHVAASIADEASA
jgi:hypothetical protein